MDDKHDMGATPWILLFYLMLILAFIGVLLLVGLSVMDMIRIVRP